jgi:hypothetical protein
MAGYAHSGRDNVRRVSPKGLKPYDVVELQGNDARYHDHTVMFKPAKVSRGAGTQQREVWQVSFKECIGPMYFELDEKIRRVVK